MDRVHGSPPLATPHLPNNFVRIEVSFGETEHQKAKGSVFSREGVLSLQYSLRIWGTTVHQFYAL